MHEMELKDFIEEVKNTEFAWSSFGNSSAVFHIPDNFFEGEVSTF